MEKDVFVTFDLSNTSSLYDDFYEKAEEIGLKRYIMGKYTNTNTKDDTALPNTTLHGRFSCDNGEQIRNSIREKISKIFKELEVKGKSIVIVSETWGINSF